MWLGLGIIFFIILVVLQVSKFKIEDVDMGVPKKIIGGLGLVFVLVGLFFQNMYYTESTYMYHVQTKLTGEELVHKNIGWEPYYMGVVQPWKRAMTVQSAGCNKGEIAGDSSARMQPYTVRLLDRVDGKVCATVRFGLPSDKETFLKLVHAYRTPENFINTALVPAWKKTINATSSMMTAEKYYSGGRNEFIYFFEDMMRNGIYKVHIKEEKVRTAKTSTSSSNVSKGGKQGTFGDNIKIIYKVIIEKGKDGVPLRNTHDIDEYGITIISATLTDFVPNEDFKERMKLQQQASADRAIAKEDRLKEEESKLLAIARGQREVEQAKYTAQKEQATLTTKAETTKQLAITSAEQQLEKAKIEDQTATVKLSRDTTIGKSIKVLSDADKYKRKNAIEADNGLALKIEALKYIANVQADAQKHRPVPNTLVINGGSGKGSGGVLGSADDATILLQTQLIKNLNNLDLDMRIKR